MIDKAITIMSAMLHVSLR